MKYVFFDFDGTLADSNHLLMKAWNLYADQYHYDRVTEEDISTSRNLTIHERAKKYRFPMHKLPIILPKVYAYFQEHIEEVQLFEGISEMLYNIQQADYKIVIISSNAKENIELLLKQQQVHSVSQILTSSRLFGKDTVIKKFMKQQKLTVDDVLYVGDEIRDIIACNKVGVPFVWVSWGLDGYELIEKEKPTYVVHSPKELSELLAKR